jgi:hypothetical protein
VKCPECKTENVRDGKKCEKCDARLLNYGDVGIIFVLIYFAAMFSFYFASLAVDTTLIQTAGYALVIGAFIASGMATMAVVHYQTSIRKRVGKHI